jgi:hypothetical protein
MEAQNRLNEELERAGHDRSDVWKRANLEAALVQLIAAAVTEFKESAEQQSKLATEALTEFRASTAETTKRVADAVTDFKNASQEASKAADKWAFWAFVVSAVVTVATVVQALIAWLDFTRPPVP